MMAFAGNDHYFIRRDRDAARAADVAGDGLAQSGQAAEDRSGSNPCAAHPRPLPPHWMAYRIGLSDFKMNDALALGSSAWLVQNFKSGFGASRAMRPRDAIRIESWHKV